MENSVEIPVIYSDDQLIVVDKPAGLAVHKNDFMQHDAPYLTKFVGDMTGRWVYNVHRLDAKTSGVMVLAFSSESARELTLQFERREVEKIYYALVLGEPGEGTFRDKVTVRKKSRIKKPAITHFRTLRTIPTSIVHKQHDPVIISLMEIRPETGRWHQIRQHFARNRFDIIGDSHHGDFSFNKLVIEKTGIRRLMLHAGMLKFTHPVTHARQNFTSTVPNDFNLVSDSLSVK